MAVLIFVLLGSVTPEEGRTQADEMRNGLFSTISFVLGAGTSILCGFAGMKIATYANARTALEARKGIAPAFMCGEYIECCMHCQQQLSGWLLLADVFSKGSYKKK